MIARWRTCRKPYSLRLLDGANDFKLNQYNKMVAFKAADFFLQKWKKILHGRCAFKYARIVDQFRLKRYKMEYVMSYTHF